MESMYPHPLIPAPISTEKMHTFDTGATRSADDDKIDYEGFLSPLALKRYAEYLHEHRVQADGTLRASDNWQQGMPKDRYMKSAWRHFFDWWFVHRQAKDGCGLDAKRIENDICGLIFNAFGYLHERMMGR